MSDEKPSNSRERRNLPSWMSSKSSAQSANKGKVASGSDGPSFSKLLEGVVFVLSGFVNPERSTLRSQALEMGAEYQPDWNANCTLLICAFPNTPKFRQVVADSGTIVSKDWISECYSQKKLVDIDPFLMHAGEPWRKQSTSHEVDQVEESTRPRKMQKKVERKPSGSSSKVGDPNHAKEQFLPAEVKRWATDDLNKTISWLESQDERPEPSEVKKIAAEGILTCLQDAIESLEQNQDIRRVTEQWNFIPRVVEELARVEGVESGKSSLSGKDILQQAITCKNIYETEFNSLDANPTLKKKRQKAGEHDKKIRKVESKATDAAYDSDDTIEMTEEEIDLAYKTIVSKVFN